MTNMALCRKIWMLYILMLSCFSIHCQRVYDMDNYATCGSTINADDDGVTLNARGTVSSANPPLRCVVYVRSAYTRNDGTNKLQIEVEAYIRDNAVTLDIFEGRTTNGRYIKRISYRQGSTGYIYSQTNQITIRLNRPDVLYQPNYKFSLLIKPWKDRDVLPPNDGKESISTGAIIGIVFGCLLLIALIILFCWCCCTGRVSGIKGRFPHSKDKRGIVTKKGDSPGLDNRALNDGKGKPGINSFNDSMAWSSVSPGNYDNKRIGHRYYQRNAPQYNYRNGGRNGEYEPYEFDRPQQGRGYNGQGYNRRYEPPQNADKENSQVNPTAAENQRQPPRKETLIDDVFESDSGHQDGDTADTDFDDETLQKRPPGDKSESPKQDRKNDRELPEERMLDGSPQLERYKSMDLQSQPDLETISSPLHINAGVMASVEDEDISPTNSLQKQKKAAKSPKLKRRGEREPDASAMPPEAFEPIFNAPITGINYPGYTEGPSAYPGGFMPYGLIPAMHFAPSAPGAQTYAYAYQTAPTGGPPAAQGAYVVQNVPTSDGNRRTAFAVEHTLGTSPKDRRKNVHDPFQRNDYRNSNGSKQGRGRHKDHDLAIISRGAAPPDPGQGHRSMAMKSGTDPDTGIQTSQVVWTDTVPDPTDPNPGENPQITRKTVTRVTTKSGHNELPPEPDPLLALGDGEPDFLSPSKRTVLSPSHPNAAIQYTPERGNIAFYTGAGSSELPPERSSTPNSVHHATSYNKAIRDRIPLDDSTV